MTLVRTSAAACVHRPRDERERVSERERERTQMPVTPRAHGQNWDLVRVNFPLLLPLLPPLLGCPCKARTVRLPARPRICTQRINAGARRETGRPAGHESENDIRQPVLPPHPSILQLETMTTYCWRSLNPAKPRACLRPIRLSLHACSATDTHHRPGRRAGPPPDQSGSRCSSS